jgi:hypothetical protein
MNSTVVWVGVGGIIVSVACVMYAVFELERKKIAKEREDRVRAVTRQGE